MQSPKQSVNFDFRKDLEKFWYHFDTHDQGQSKHLMSMVKYFDSICLANFFMVYAKNLSFKKSK